MGEVIPIDRQPVPDTYVEMTQETITVANFKCAKCARPIRLPDVSNTPLAPLLTLRDMEFVCPVCQAPQRLRTSVIVTPQVRAKPLPGQKL